MRLLTKLIQNQDPGYTIDPAGIWTYVGEAGNFSANAELNVDSTGTSTYTPFSTVGSTENPDVVWDNGKTYIFQYDTTTGGCTSSAQLTVELTPYYDLEIERTVTTETLELLHTVIYDNTVPANPKLEIQAVLLNSSNNIKSNKVTNQAFAWNKSTGGQTGIFALTNANPLNIDSFGNNWEFYWDQTIIFTTFLDIVFTDNDIPATAGVRLNYNSTNMSVGLTWAQDTFYVDRHVLYLTSTNPLPSNTTYKWFFNNALTNIIEEKYETYQPGDYRVEITVPGSNCPLEKTYSI